MTSVVPNSILFKPVIEIQKSEGHRIEKPVIRNITRLPFPFETKVLIALSRQQVALLIFLLKSSRNISFFIKFLQ